MTSIWHPADYNSQATSSLFSSEMIAILKGHKVPHNKTSTKHKAAQLMGTTINKQQQNYNHKTDSRRSHWKGGGLNRFYWPNLALGSAVVKIHNAYP